jgi:hypothetical protein
VIDWIRGDLLGLEFPAHADALRDGAEEFLTRAFRAAGAIASDNRVCRITECEECPGGSTGRKLLLSVKYRQPEGMHTALFVKFSRDFSSDIRDRARYQMEAEVRFALLSRGPGFPIEVPTCYFADFHHASGTGILITARIPYGSGIGGEHVEPHYEKCLDYTIPEPLAHYRAIIRALARLAGTHKSGRLSGDVAKHFPYDAGKLAVSERDSYNEQQIRERVARYAEFAARYPQLLPDNIRSAQFIDRLSSEAPRLITLEPRIQHLLVSEPDLIALCHWNANIDNAWFMHSGEALECGLMDWGHVSQMNIAMSLWGCLSGAELALWDDHLCELLALYATEFCIAGGPSLNTQQLKTHLLLYAALMGLNWLLDVPAFLLRKFPELPDFSGRMDQRLSEFEAPRTQLQMMTVFLNFWQREDMDSLLRDLEAQPLSI